MKTSSLYTDTVQKLRHCYDTHADKFSSTRHKKRPEFDYIVQRLLSHPSTSLGLDIIELGCGDGRLYGYLQTQYPDLVKSYKGIDISEQLLHVAKKKHPQKQAQWIHDDMIHYLSQQSSESQDIIICVASFQHLPDSLSRETVLYHIYRILLYGGLFISIDRSWSWRLVKKHHTIILDSLKKFFTTLGKREWNNLLIPFSNQGKEKIFRLYHIFTTYELSKLLRKYGFYYTDFIYSSQDGSFHHNILQARNICTCSQKKIMD